MKSTKKRFSIVFIVLVYAISLFAGLGQVLAGEVAYASTQYEGYSYFYDNLTIEKNGSRVEYTLAKNFYNALTEINNSGAFKKGIVSYDLSQIITSEQIKNWVIDGQLEIPKAFSAARDSFLMDHPELFYVDMYKLTISASRSNGVYSAYIDTGREANCYREKTFKSETEVAEAIQVFENKVKEIVDNAKQEAENDTRELGKDLKLAIAANEQIANSVKYDFGTYNEVLAGQDVSVAKMTFSSYGALVNEYAVCAGFASAYKVILDRLDIPCIIVSGYSKGKDKQGSDTEGDVGHSWNYVWLETAEKDGATARTLEKKGEWFAFDTTWNSVNADKNKYSAMDAIKESKGHISDGVISSSGYKLTYPALSNLSYKEACDPNNMDRELDVNGFKYVSKHEYIIDLDTYEVWEKVSYNGKNSGELLAQDGLRMINRYECMENGELKWSKWQDVYNSTKYYENSSGIKDDEDHSSLYIAQNIYHTQYAIIQGLEPDLDVEIIDWEDIFYSDDNAVEQHLIYKSQEFENQVYGSYTPAPFIVNEKSYPYAGGIITINDNMAESSSSSVMADKHAFTISLVYDEPLHAIDDSKPIVVEFTSEFANAKNYASFVAFEDGKYVHLVADDKGVMNTLQFKFKPSLMYEHNRSGYLFTFKNVGSAKIVDKKVNGGLERTTSDKAPNYAYYVFARNYIACPCVFGDGRLWVDCCALPQLVDNSDLSDMGFKDEEGNNLFTENNRSQMMLVVDRVNTQTENAMMNEINSYKNINVKKEDIKASQTYDINLQICGQTKKIPDGSYVKIALGFPEGYGPEDEGVTFKLFHRKHVSGDQYVIEEVPCVVTMFGIVATVDSFSPYMVAVVPEEKATNKTIYASIDGKGGKLTKQDGKIQTVKKGESYTYTINADEGYKLYSITLNGVNLAEKVVNGKLTLSYDDLARNNELEIQFISDEAAERYETLNIVPPVKVVVSTSGEASVYDFVEGDVFPERLSVGAVIGIILGSILFVAAITAVVVIVTKKNKAFR